MNRLSSHLDRRATVLLASSILIVSFAAYEALRGAPASAQPRSAQELGLPSPDALAQDLLTQFESIYNRRDAEAYAAMFDPWVFEYEFSPLDKDWGAPQAWAYAQEVAAARKMFTDPRTTLIDLRLVQEDEATQASRGDVVPIDSDGVWKVSAAAYLAVERTGADGRVDRHRIRGQIHEFYFRRGTEDEGRAWRIVYWRDLTGRRGELSSRLP